MTRVLLYDDDLEKMEKRAEELDVDVCEIVNMLVADYLKEI